jgi:drug/metabolite transporter (DMT)-like permease
MDSPNTRRNAVVMLLLTAILWSTSGLLIKLVSWGPLTILGMRSLIAGIFFLVYLRPTHLRFTRYQVFGALCYLGTNLFFISATKLTSAANAIFLQYACPVYVVIFGYWLLKEKPRRADWVALAVILAGLALFFGDKLSFNGFYGNLLAILSGVAFAGTMVFMRLQKDEQPARMLLLGNFISALVGLPFLLGEPSFPPADFIILLYLGTFQIGLSYLFYALAIRHIRALEANLILTLEPILNPIWVFLVIGEKPGPMALLGSLLVIGAVTFRAVVSSRAETNQSADFTDKSKKSPEGTPG